MSIIINAFTALIIYAKKIPPDLRFIIKRESNQIFVIYYFTRSGRYLLIKNFPSSLTGITMKANTKQFSHESRVKA